MKAVLISIQPRWCEPISSGKKTIEVRKTKPKLETPFKVYIYQTLKPVSVMLHGTGRHISEYDKTLCYNERSGKVIGEFVCAEIKEITADNLVAIYFNNPQESTCLNDLEMRKYADGKNLFLWHISALVIYDKPRELGEFITPTTCKSKVSKSMMCNTCCLSSNFCSKKPKRIIRPPQSWCYVEGLE